MDSHPQWDSFKRGCAIQRTEALNLHWEVNVPLSACGYPELQKFALAPSLYDYQLLVIDETRSYRVDAFGPPQYKQLVLLYNQQHYDVVTSLPGFFGTSYFCGAASNPTTMKVNMLVKTVQTIVQPVYRMFAVTTDKPKISDVQPRFDVTGANVRSMVRPAFNNILADLTREKLWTP